jgi:hypothetical protein
MCDVILPSAYCLLQSLFDWISSEVYMYLVFVDEVMSSWYATAIFDVIAVNIKVVSCCSWLYHVSLIHWSSPVQTWAKPSSTRFVPRLIYFLHTRIPCIIHSSFSFSFTWDVRVFMFCYVPLPRRLIAWTKFIKLLAVRFQIALNKRRRSSALTNTPGQFSTRWIKHTCRRDTRQ